MINASYTMALGGSLQRSDIHTGFFVAGNPLSSTIGLTQNAGSGELNLLFPNLLTPILVYRDGLFRPTAHKGGLQN